MASSIHSSNIELKGGADQRKSLKGQKYRVLTEGSTTPLFVKINGGFDVQKLNIKTQNNIPTKEIQYLYCFQICPICVVLSYLKFKVYGTTT